MRRVERGQAARVVEEEALVVLRRERDVARAHLLGGGHEVGHVKVLGCERLGEALVLLAGTLVNELGPLAARELRVQSPVHEQAQAHVLIVLDARQRLAHGVSLSCGPKGTGSFGPSRLPSRDQVNPSPLVPLAP